MHESEADLGSETRGNKKKPSSSSFHHSHHSWSWSFNMVPKLREKFLPGISVDLKLDFFGVATPSQEQMQAFERKTSGLKFPEQTTELVASGGGGGAKILSEISAIFHSCQKN